MRDYRMRALLPALCLVAASAQAQTTPVTPRTMIVMDGSGSMWGQIGGVPKLEIARDVVADVLAGMDPNASLGLIAYGHRRRGDCSDIEVMVEPAAGSASEISGRVNAMRFQGRTPLTDAVRRAAEVLRHSEDPATVVLVTDGIETCEADPCALGRELEASGVNFTAHVVGFGLSQEEGAQVACLAEETGGRYFQADDAAALTEALTQTLAAPEPAPAPAPEPMPEPEPEPVVETPRVPAGPWYPGPAFQEGLQLTPTGRSRERGGALPAEISFPADGTAEMCQQACAADAQCTVWQYEPQGSFFIEEARCHLYNADAEFEYSFEAGFAAGTNPDEPQLTRPFEAPLPEATLSAPASISALSWIEVTVTGPLNPGDYVDIVERGALRTHQPQSFTELAGATQVRIQTPATPGAYDLRYIEVVEGREARVLAVMALEVSNIAYALSAPDSVAGGSPVAVDWTGPQAEGDYLDIIEAGADRTHAAAADAYVTEGNPLTLIAPLVPGAYDLRYIVEGPEGRYAAISRPLTVTEPVASLTAPDMAGPATEVTVQWTGPARGANWIELVPAGQTEMGGELTYAYLDPAQPSVSLLLPDQPGDYLLRFIAEDMRLNRAIVATRPITVVPGVVPPASPSTDK